jgi:hypothetical protein
MRYVSIAIHGQYLRLATADVGDHLHGPSLYADGTGIGDESIFERIEFGENRIALRSLLLGGYLQAHPDGIVLVNPAIGDWETFTEIRWPDDRISLKTAHGTFVCAESGGGRHVVTNRTAAGDWEKFFYEVPPAELLPAEEPVEESSPLTDSIQDSSARRAVAREIASQHIESKAPRLPLGP